MEPINGESIVILRWPIGLSRCFLSIRGLNIYANTSDRPRRIVFSKNVSTVTSPAIQKGDIFFMTIPQSHSAAVKAVKSGTQLTHRHGVNPSVETICDWHSCRCLVEPSIETNLRFYGVISW